MLRSGKFSAHSNLIHIAIIFLVTFVVYWNSLQGDFIWDDKGIILSNTGYLENWKNVFSIFTKPFFGKASTYRPFLIVSFIVDYQLWGSNPVGFHYTNVLLHAMNACMVYLFVLILFKNNYLSFFSSLLFVAHPVQTEAVAWISGRNDVLLTFFSLLTLISYIRWYTFTGVKRVVAFLLFLASYGCVLLTKESGVVVLLLIILVDYFFKPALPNREDSTRKAYLSIVLISVAYFYLRLTVLGSMGLGASEREYTLRGVGALITYAYYFKMLLLPVQQTANPFVPYLKSVKDPALIFPLCFVFSLVLLSVVCWKRVREVPFIILWIVITLLPVSGIVPLTVPALEHRLYLGTVAFSIILPLLTYRSAWPEVRGVSPKLSGELVMFFLLICTLCIYSVKTVNRNSDWKDEHHFWLKTVQESPFSVFAHNNLGLVYAGKGHYAKAIDEFKKAIVLNPGAGNAYANLGAVYVSQHLYQSGLNAYEEALQLKPNWAKAYDALADLYYQVLKDEGVSSKKKYPGTDAARLVEMYGVEGLYQMSHNNYKKAIQLDPSNAEYHNNLGDLYYLVQSYQAAMEEYTRAVESNPYYADAYNNLGLIHFHEKRYDDAQEKFLKTLELKPDFAEARNNLALSYFNKGLYHKALEEFTGSLKLMPENAEIHFNLALVYLRGFKDKQKGVYYLEKSLRLDPYHSRAEIIRETLSQFTK